MSEINVGAVDQAEASFLAQKEAYYASEKTAEDKAAFEAAKSEFVNVRRQYREQEVAAGRRAGAVSVVVEAGDE